jgi:hypothetical protein
MAATPAKRTSTRKPTQTNVAALAPKGTKTYKFSTLTRDAKAKMDARAAERPEVPPFVIDDVSPPIVVTAPDTLERMLVAAEGMGVVMRGDMSAVMPLLRALCGDAFERVWWLVREDKGPDRILAVVMAIAKHFEEVLAPLMEANELPGGSEDSGD